MNFQNVRFEEKMSGFQAFLSGSEPGHSRAPRQGGPDTCPDPDKSVSVCPVGLGVGADDPPVSGGLWISLEGFKSPTFVHVEPWVTYSADAQPWANVQVVSGKEISRLSWSVREKRFSRSHAFNRMSQKTHLTARVEAHMRKVFA